MPRRLTRLLITLVMLPQLAAAAAGAPGSGRPKYGERPNVLFIAVDDLNHWVGSLGRNPQTATPNIDRLAARGVRFTHAYCAAPSCTPSRAALMSGLRPSTTGVYENYNDWSPAVPPDKCLPAAFRAGGYATFAAGKIYHGGTGGRPDEWDQVLDNPRGNPNHPRGVKPRFTPASGAASPPTPWNTPTSRAGRNTPSGRARSGEVAAGEECERPRPEARPCAGGRRINGAGAAPVGRRARESPRHRFALTSWSRDAGTKPPFMLAYIIVAWPIMRLGHALHALRRPPGADHRRHRQHRQRERGGDARDAQRARRPRLAFAARTACTRARAPCSAPSCVRAFVRSRLDASVPPPHPGVAT